MYVTWCGGNLSRWQLWADLMVWTAAKTFAYWIGMSAAFAMGHSVIAPGGHFYDVHIREFPRMGLGKLPAYEWVRAFTFWFPGGGLGLCASIWYITRWISLSCNLMWMSCHMDIPQRSLPQTCQLSVAHWLIHMVRPLYVIQLSVEMTDGQGWWVMSIQTPCSMAHWLLFPNSHSNHTLSVSIFTMIANHWCWVPLLDPSVY